VLTKISITDHLWTQCHSFLPPAVSIFLRPPQITIKEVIDKDRGFAKGQYVEVLDDHLELDGKPGQLVQISDDSDRPILRMESTVNALAQIANADGADKGLHPKIRRWDSLGALKAEIPVGNDGWIPIEGGIEVKFSKGVYKSGDYWLIPARTDTGDIEWPPHETPNINPIPQQPIGVKHHYSRIAIARVEDDGKFAITDCRKVFPPLEGVPAIHIMGTSWSNDDILTISQFSKNGLGIIFDNPPEPLSVSASTLIVSVETTLAGNPSSCVILKGAINITGRIVRWSPIFSSGFLDDLIKAGPVRARVHLKGHVIWCAVGEQRLYLDGQAFGDFRSDENQTPRTALIFPSGNCDRASDFDSWFYLAKANPLVIEKVLFITNQGNAITVIPKNYVSKIPTLVKLKPVPIKENITTIEIHFSREVSSKGFLDDKKPKNLMILKLSKEKEVALDADHIMENLQNLLKEKKVEIVAGEISVRKKIVIFTVAKTFLAERKKFLSEGSYRILALGNDFKAQLQLRKKIETIIAIRAKDDNSPLDGNYDDEPGDNFVFPFQILSAP
jgi:hypothetical protein